MNLEELRAQWAAYDRKLDKLLRFNTAAAREARLAKARTRVRWLGTLAIVEGVLSLGFGIFLVVFLAQHRGATRLEAYAAILLAALVPSLALNVRVLALLGRIDYGAPVVAIQKRIEALRIGRVYAGFCELAAGAALWPLALIVLLEALHGIDWSGVSAAFLAANAAVGVLGGAALWRFRNRPGLQAPFAGAMLESARAQLAELAAFEREA
jgi:hypothetical protein